MVAFLFSIAVAFILSPISALELNTDLVDLNDYDVSRTFYFNSTYAGYWILAGIVGIIIIVKIIAVAYYLYDYYYTPARVDVNYGQYQDQNYYNQQAYASQTAYYRRSAQDNFDFNSMNVIQWISMLQELYEKFDYKDLDCQKRLICEVMKEPEYFGTVATQIKNGFQYAKYLEVLSLPDDMRETLDEYMEANSRAEGQKDCTEYFQCPYSLKESVKKNWEGNSL